jgi:preprotein translocase subunit SecE
MRREDVLKAAGVALLVVALFAGFAFLLTYVIRQG